MRIASDAELLHDYAGHGSEAAFGEIVRRYADFVYSAALRQVWDAEQARDVAQMVFADLARKAGSLPANTLLVGWLCQSARLAALEQLRKDQRRLKRERQAMDLLDRSSDNPSDWSAVRPVLDEAIASLADEDRNALLLRFFKNETLASVGTSLGVSEDAAQKRVSRSLDKLRDFLERRGIKTTAAALSVALAANAVHSAPAGLAASLTTGALASASAAGGSAFTFVKLLTASNMKMTALALVLATALGGMTVSRIAVHKRWTESAALSARQAEDLVALRRANEQQLSNLTAEVDRLRDDAQDVLRLRAEVSQLKRDLAVQWTNSLRRVNTSRGNSSTNATASTVYVGTKVVFIPAHALSAIRSAGLPFLQSGGTALLSADQYSRVNEAITNADGVTTIGSPGVVTGNGRPAKLFIGESIPFSQPDATVGMTNIGWSLDIVPAFSNNSSSVEINVAGELSRLIETSIQQDGSLPSVEKLETGRTSMSIPEGVTMVLATDLAGGSWMKSFVTNANSGDGTLLTFLTPKIEKTPGNFQLRLVAPVRATITPPK